MTYQRPFRIAPDQATLTRHQQALMTLDEELNLVVYRGILQLAETNQREALLHIINTEYNTTIDLPGIPSTRGGAKASLLAHFMIIDGAPELWYDEDNPCAMAYAFALGRKGRAAAQRVSYRSGMTPPPPAGKS
jgi:hypothetical protein